MRRSKFAELIGVTKQQVSKYNAYLVLNGNEVDVGESLAALEGHLDEEKRQRALAAWAVMNGQRAVAPAAPAAQAVVDRSAKAKKDEVDLALKQIELAERAGALVSVEDVEDRARQAVVLLREQAVQQNRETADVICAQFGLTPDKAPALTRLLGDRFELLMGAYSAAMAALADENAVIGASANEFDLEVAPEAVAATA